MLESHIARFYAKNSHFLSVRSKRAILSEIPLSKLEIDKNIKQFMNQAQIASNIKTYLIIRCYNSQSKYDV